MLARFGKDVIFQSKIDSVQHNKLKQKIIVQHPETIKSIDSTIEEITKIVKHLHPVKLMQMSWMKLFMSMRDIQAEADIGKEQTNFLRMIDYIQSIIASTPTEEYKDEVEDIEWLKLSALVEKLFDLVNGPYQIGATFLRSIQDPDHDIEVEELRFKAQIYWCNVRGERFLHHQTKALESLISPQTDLIVSTFGITSKVIIEEFEKIMYAQTYGMHEAFTTLNKLRLQFLDSMKEKNYKDLSPADAYAQFLQNTDSVEANKNSLDRCFGMGLFDLRKITNLPDSFLDLLSWSPGEDKDFMLEGTFKGWPLKIWPTFKRPFLKFEGSYYCFDLHGLFDKIYRQLEKQVFGTTEKNKQAWIKTRNIVSEQLPIDYLSAILPGAEIVKEAYYNIIDPVTGKQKTCETDGLFIYGDTLLILEIKAASFTYTSPADDFEAFTSSLKTLVQNPINQGVRFLDFLNSQDEVIIYNKEKQEITRLRSSNFKNKIVCAISLDPFTELAAQTQNLEKLGIDLGESFSWSLSIDDLQVYADIFTEPLLFLHYIEQRMLASKAKILELDDELDHLGLYIAHNNYVSYARAKIAGSGARLRFHGYRSDIDIYFSELNLDKDTPNLLTAKLPIRFSETINRLSSSTSGIPSAASTHLLNIEPQQRKNIFDMLHEHLLLSFTKLKPLSCYSEANITIYPTSENLSGELINSAIEHTQAVMLVTNEAKRNLLILSYNEQSFLQDLHWEELTLNAIPPEKLETLRLQSKSLREKRIANALLSSKKIGRNDPCVCASGKKYKHCCLSNTD